MGHAPESGVSNIRYEYDLPGAAGQTGYRDERLHKSLDEHNLPLPTILLIKIIRESNEAKDYVLTAQTGRYK